MQRVSKVLKELAVVVAEDPQNYRYDGRQPQLSVSMSIASVETEILAVLAGDHKLSQEFQFGPNLRELAELMGGSDRRTLSTMTGLTWT